jgi:hypothetical protein
VRFCRPVLLLVLPVAAVAAGCGGGRMSASDVAGFLRRTQPTAFADIRCVPNRASGWDYVCTYTDPHQGREKLGVAVHGKSFVASGSAPVADVLPDGPHSKNTGGDFARRANALCSKRAAAVRDLPPVRTQNDLIDYGERVSRLELGERSRLAGIRPPSEQQAQVSVFLGSLTTLQRRIETLRNALQRRDAAAILSAERDLKSARQRSTSLARGLGLTCRY